MDVFKYIRGFDLPETIREQIVFSDPDKIRLDPQDHKIKLVEDKRGYPHDRYPTGNHYAVLPVMNPLSHKVWVAAQVLASVPENTEMTFILHDGVSYYEWDSTVIPPPGQWVERAVPLPNRPWNTIEEINEHLLSFISPHNPHTIGLVVKLKTLDNENTPELSGYKWLFNVYFDEHESVLVDSMTDYFKQVLVKADFDYQNDTGGDITELDLNDFDLGKLDVVSASAAFAISSDPDMMTDILDSYNPTTRVATLITSIPNGKAVRLRLVYIPTVAITTHQDYIELASVPAIVIEDIRVVQRLKAVAGEDFVAEGADNGWEMPELENVTFRAKAVIQTELLVDQMRVARAVELLLGNDKQMLWKDTDELLDIVKITPYASAFRPNMENTLAGSLEFEIRNVPYYISGAVEIPVIKTVDIQLSK